LHAVTESSDLWNEIMNYCYAQDKNGNYTDMPIDGFNHLIDSLRYVVQDQRGKKEIFGI
jgi:phage terminase large subunit